MIARARSERAKLTLRLYIAGESPNSILARGNLDAAIAHLAPEEVTLEVVDVLRDPARCLLEGVLVTPMLVRLSPPPERRVIGNLRDRALLASLGLGETSE